MLKTIVPIIVWLGFDPFRPVQNHMHRLLLLLGWACMMMAHLCMMHVPIRGRTRSGYMVPRAQGVPKVGFPVRPKICVLSQRWVQVREQVAGSLPRRQPGTGTRQAEGRGVVAPSLHPEVPGIQFVSPDTDWTSGNQWAGRRCVGPHGRRFGC